jgi:uncharacterized protein YlxW (UPF0749 family)
MIATICLMTGLLVCIMFMQFKTVEKTDIKALEAMRETELRAEVASWKTKYEETNKKYEDTLLKIDEYKSKIINNQETSELLLKELEQANMALGKTDVVGSGIIITLSDNDIAQIEAYDIFKLINDLRLAGAEAISVNDERIINMSDVKDIAPGLIVIDDTRIMSPYVIKAIGDTTYLESGLTLKTYGYMDLVIKGYDKTGTIERSDNILIKKYNKEMKLDYAEEVTKQ